MNALPRPGFAVAIVIFPLALGASWWAWQRHPGVGVIGWVTSVLWTLPLSSSVIGLAGGIVSRRRLRRRSLPAPRVIFGLLVVVVPTIGRWDTCPALERVVRSYLEHLPVLFKHVRVDLVVEERCEALIQIRKMAGPLVRIVVVPRDYRPPDGTRFKARAAHYAHELRISEGEARDDVWLLHMDDDTGVGPDTAQAVSRFVTAQQLAGSAGLHLAQGVLTYPREYGRNRLIWMADAIRPACDISLFVMTTGGGTPRAGLHGELLLVRASVEAKIGWDFGPGSIVEDAEFALRFSDLFPGRSDWFGARCYGASPATLLDLFRQRERWSWGLITLCADRALPLRHRVLLLHNVLVWVWGPFQHIGVILAAGALLGDLNTLPVTSALLPIWALNVTYTVWLYWEGLKINAASSARPGRRWWEPAAVLLLLPLFSFWEAIGVFRGLLRWLRHSEPTFTVISKPA
jgi:egghead protein (zeste-white 4 protein)